MDLSTFLLQISLGDYLKRPKKPLDQRRPPPLPAPPLDSPSTPSTSSYQSFHQTPHSVAVAPTAASSTNSYASISPTSGGTPLSSTMTPSASGSGGLQFEPVSPGEDDGTPPLVTMEGKTRETSHLKSLSCLTCSCVKAVRLFISFVLLVLANRFGFFAPDE